jgi:CRISPR/Cas system-associated exonuclease Cas4 (RecB family)
MAAENAPKAARADFVAAAASRSGLASRRPAGLLKAAGEILDAFAESGLADRREVERLETPVEARLERLVFRGTVDRIDRAEDGFRVVDYKGKTPRDEYHYQVRFYAWILEKAQRPASKEAFLCYLRKPVEIVPVDVSPAHLEALEGDARRLEQAVGEGRFDPSPGPVCDACAFRRICPHVAASSRGSS